LSSNPTHLNRDIGLSGAVFIGLGSILGTGVFVSIGLGAGAAGASVVLAILFAAALAACNGLSSAQLAAAYPVSGGTYEYARRLISPSTGFAAGWLFLCAKTASAATAALGCSAYALHMLELNDPLVRTLLALCLVFLLTALVMGGARRTSLVNTLIVTVTLLALGGFVLFGLPYAFNGFHGNLLGNSASISGLRLPGPGIFEATALMFVAFTGYGRIATMGEEVINPTRTIPRAIILTLIISTVLYAAVGVVAISAVGAEVLAQATSQTAAPLEHIARTFNTPGLSLLVAIGAMTAMLSVLLNLILGLSRVVLSMARQRDLPNGLSRINPSGVPVAAVLLVGVLICAIAAAGSIELAWSFSALTVLLYYAVTNIAALKLSVQQRLYPRWISLAGLVACVGLSIWIDAWLWLAGGGLLLAGFLLRYACHKFIGGSPSDEASPH
jgi:basic amino acid/polyamine antiporter, APA family